MNDVKKEKFAYELANTLADRISLPAYRVMVATYQEAYLRERLLKVMSIPDHQIKRSRGALFTYLVKQNGHDFKSDSRD